MYAVKIKQIMDGTCVGDAILTERFDNFDEAMDAGRRYGVAYDEAVISIRRYDGNAINIISFDDNDTGIPCGMQIICGDNND